MACAITLVGVLLAGAAHACAGGRMELDEFVAFTRDGKGLWRLMGTVVRGEAGGVFPGDVSLHLVRFDLGNKQKERRALPAKKVISALPRRGELVELKEAPLVELARAALKERASPGGAKAAREDGLEVSVTGGFHDGYLCGGRRAEDWPAAFAVELRGRLRQRFLVRIEQRPEAAPYQVRTPPEVAVMAPGGEHLVVTVRGSQSDSFHQDTASHTRVVRLDPACVGTNPPRRCTDASPFLAPDGAPDFCAEAMSPCDPARKGFACREGGQCVGTDAGHVCAECSSDAWCAERWPKSDPRAVCSDTPSVKRCGGCTTDADCSGKPSTNGLPLGTCDTAAFVCSECQTDADCLALLQPDERGRPTAKLRTRSGLELGVWIDRLYLNRPGGRVSWSCERSTNGGSCLPRVEP